MKLKSTSTFKKTLLMATLIGSLLTGCGTLLPKNVEFFQKKVKKVPIKTEQTQELERQAAVFIDKKVDQALAAANKEGASTNVVDPLKDAHTVAPALSTSLGPPKTEFKGPPAKLEEKLNHNTATLNEKIQDYRESVQPLEGKKIEGTGKVQINYFVWIGLIVGGGFVLFNVIKIALNVASTMNPAVGMGMNVAKIPAKQVAKGFSEMVEGGEHFKDLVKEKIEEADIQEKVLDLFSRAHKEKQSRDVQGVIKNITS